MTFEGCIIKHSESFLAAMNLRLDVITLQMRVN